MQVAVQWPAASAPLPEGEHPRDSLRFKFDYFREYESERRDTAGTFKIYSRSYQNVLIFVFLLKSEI